MITFLIIACSLLAILTVGSTWILILVVRNNENITAERNAARSELWKATLEVVEVKADLFTKNEIIMSMERGAGMLERSHNVALEGLHRIIGQLLLKQEGLTEQDTRNEEFFPEPLKLVEGG